MYAQKEKPKDNKRRTVANSVVQKKSNVKQGYGFVDNRNKSTLRSCSNEPITKGLTLKRVPRMADDVKIESTKERSSETMQLALNDALTKNTLNVVGELHGEIEDKPQKVYMEQLGIPSQNFWHEYEFKYLYQYNTQDAKEVTADPKIYRVQASNSIAMGWIAFLFTDIRHTVVSIIRVLNKINEEVSDEKRRDAMKIFNSIADEDLGIPGLIELIDVEIGEQEADLKKIPIVQGSNTPHTATKELHQLMTDNLGEIKTVFDSVKYINQKLLDTSGIITLKQLASNEEELRKLLSILSGLSDQVKDLQDAFVMSQLNIDIELGADFMGGTTAEEDDFTAARSSYMHEGANHNYQDVGVWKIGEQHVRDIIKSTDNQGINYNLVGVDSYRRLLLNAGLLQTPVDKFRDTPLTQ